MRSKFLALGLFALCSLVACEKKSPTAPEIGGASSTAASADARVGVTQAAPTPISPEDNQNVANSRQPVTLTVSNGLSTVAGKAPTYTFEIATDNAFANIVFSKADVAEGTNNRTSVTASRLTADTVYYWRARTVVSGAAGPNSKIRAFKIGPVVTIQAPLNNAPANAATTGIPVQLSVINSARTGPAGALHYEFEVSTNQNFEPVFYQVIIPEQNSTTAANVGGLTQGVTYFWHARAIDNTNDITTPWGNTRQFTPQTFDPTRAVFHDNPPDIGFWPETAKIKSIVFTPHSMEVDFDRREGGNRWPDVVPPGWQGALQYTLGMCLNLNGTWHCSAVVQFWYGRDLSSSGAPSDVSFEWFYDPGRWGALQGRQPAEGETVAMFVVAGDARNNSFTMATCPRVCERSDFVLVPFTRYGGVSYP